MEMDGAPILIVSTVHPENDVRIVAKQAVSLRNDLEVSVNAHFWNSLFDNFGELNFGGVRVSVHRYSVKWGRIIRKILVLFDAAKKTLTLNSRLIILHDPELIPLGIVLKFFRKRIVYDAHEDFPMQLEARFGGGTFLGFLGRMFGAAFVKLADLSADGVMGATPQVLERFKKAPTQLVRNFPMLSEFSEPKDFESRQKGKICYVGGLSRLRGVREMIEAVNLVEDPDVRLFLAGRWESERYRNECLLANDKARVVDMGIIGREEVGELLNDSVLGIVVLYPTIAYKEALPVKMFEYMAAGTAVIGANFPVIESVLIEESCGVTVPPKDVIALKTAIEERLDNLAETKQMGDRGRKAVENKYSWEVEETGFVQFISRVKVIRKK